MVRQISAFAPHPRGRLAQQVRVVCSSGGHFARQASGNLEYEGGETRLVSVANFCSLADLQEALERVAAARQGGGARPGCSGWGLSGHPVRVWGVPALCHDSWWGLPSSVLCKQKG